MRNYVYLAVCALVLATSSCIAPKKIVYLKDMRLDSLYDATRMELMEIQPNDRLSIMVSSKQAELAAPFNLELGAYRVTDSGDVSTASSLATGMSREKGYIVNDNGDIDFPTLGSIHAAGMTFQELSEHIKQLLVKGAYIKDPLVRVELLNMKISLMGEVARPGVYPFDDTRVTIFDALNRSMGTTANAMISKVAVYRSTGNKVQMLLTDLTSASVFESPGYYLQQNDMVYVLPRSAQQTADESRSWRLYSTVLGMIQFGMTMYLFFK